MEEDLFFRVWRNKILVKYIFSFFFDENKRVNFYQIPFSQIQASGRIDLLLERLKVHRQSHGDGNHFKNGLSEDSLNHRIDMNNEMISNLIYFFNNQHQNSGIEVIKLFREYYKEFKFDFDLYISKLTGDIFPSILSLDLEILKDLLLSNKIVRKKIHYYIPELLKSRNFELIKYIFETDDPFYKTLVDLITSKLFLNSDRWSFNSPEIPCSKIFIYLYNYYKKLKYEVSTSKRFLSEQRISIIFNQGDIMALKIVIEDLPKDFSQTKGTLKVTKDNLECFYFLINRNYPTLYDISSLYYSKETFKYAQEIQSKYKDDILHLNKRCIFLQDGDLTVDNIKYLEELFLLEDVLDYHKMAYLALVDDNYDVLVYLCESRLGLFDFRNLFSYKLSPKTVSYFLEQKLSMISFTPSTSYFPESIFLDDKRIQDLILSVFDDKDHFHHIRFTINSDNIFYLLNCERFQFTQRLVERIPSILGYMTLRHVFQLNATGFLYYLEKVKLKPRSRIYNTTASLFVSELIAQKNVKAVREFKRVFLHKTQIYAPSITITHLTPNIFDELIEIETRNIKAFKIFIDRCIDSNNINLLKHLYNKYSKVLLSRKYAGTLLSFGLILSAIGKGNFKIIEFILLINHPLLIFNLTFDYLQPHKNKECPTISRKPKEELKKLIQFRFNSLDLETKTSTFYFVVRKSFKKQQAEFLNFFEEINFIPSFKEFLEKPIPRSSNINCNPKFINSQSTLNYLKETGILNLFPKYDK